MYYLGIDLGGTSIKAGIVTEAGDLIAKDSVKTLKGASAEKIAADIAKLSFIVAEKAGIPFDEITAAGVGVPGGVEPETGIVDFCCNLGFHRVPFSEMIERRINKRVYLENDANAAALAEYVAGSGRGSSSLIAITLGTGIGGGIIINDRIYSGFNHAAGEIGHFVIQQGGLDCTCGRRGCFEVYASATALIRMTKEKMLENPGSLMWQIAGELDGVDGKTAFSAKKQNDMAAEELIKQYSKYLASGVTSIVNIFQPEVVCIGGGLSYEGENLLEPVRAILNMEDLARSSNKRTKLVCASLGNDAGIIGAALVPRYN